MTSALKGTDAFGPGSNRIEELDCRLDRENREPRQPRKFLNSSACWLGLPILVDAAVVAADPLQLLFDCPHNCDVLKFRIGRGLLDWCRKRCDFLIGWTRSRQLSGFVWVLLLFLYISLFGCNSLTLYLFSASLLPSLPSRGLALLPLELFGVSSAF
jgi:hypothetical protein